MNPKQNGMVMVISLLLILVITLLILSNMKNSFLEEKITSNFRNQMIAFQAAETTLREAELWLEKQKTKPTTNTRLITKIDVWSKDALEEQTTNNIPWWLDKNFNWWKNNARKSEKILSPAPYQASRYIIEELQSIEDIVSSPDKGERQFYRITVLATGGSATAQIKLQTTYVKRFDNMSTIPENTKSALGRQSWQQL